MNWVEQKLNDFDVKWKTLVEADINKLLCKSRLLVIARIIMSNMGWHMLLKGSILEDDITKNWPDGKVRKISFVKKISVTVSQTPNTAGSSGSSWQVFFFLSLRTRGNVTFGERLHTTTYVAKRARSVSPAPGQNSDTKDETRKRSNSDSAPVRLLCSVGNFYTDKRELAEVIAQMIIVRLDEARKKDPHLF